METNNDVRVSTDRVTSARLDGLFIKAQHWLAGQAVQKNAKSDRRQHKTCQVVDIRRNAVIDHVTEIVKTADAANSEPRHHCSL